MESVFIFIVVIMFLLAIADLIVGVSNDAVNFLNSAIGAKASSFRNIMIIASIGIMIGAVFSSGMMEVARKGVFNPQYFTIEEIMFLFAAVMLTDIILLDFYNTIALPTSTTVSIVFELLGSAIAISFFSVLNSGQPLDEWGNYINGSRAILIIFGIFLSVIVAFILGWFVQFIARIIVTFQTRKAMRSFGSVFGALSVALITVFIVLKGLKGIPFISADVLDQIRNNIGTISIVAFIISFIVFQLLIGNRKFNVYQFITLLGTFALAMAFASNDLVNFVGVPIASFDSYMHWKASDVPSDQYLMEALAKPVQTNPVFLIIAGIIMTLTLWLSRKARSVVQTSVNLGRQYEGAERFQGNEISRGIVRSISSFSHNLVKLVPDQLVRRIDSRFAPVETDKKISKADRPAFDMLRASINLIVAAAIILFATSLKLPLSTTFVTFMVLMGTSLADRAWSSGSAVYRVSGVLTVIGGWFLTAIIALTVSMIFASLIISFKLYALIALVLIATIMIFRNLAFYKKRQKIEASIDQIDHWLKSDTEVLTEEIKNKLVSIVNTTYESYDSSISEFVQLDRKGLYNIKVRVEEAINKNQLNQIAITRQLQDVPVEIQDNRKLLMLIYDLEENILQSLETIIHTCEKHVLNLHPNLTKEQIETLSKTRIHFTNYINAIIGILNKVDITKEDKSKIKKVRKKLIQQIDDGISHQISLSKEKKLSGKSSEIVLRILLTSKNIVTLWSRFIKLFRLIKTTKDTKYVLNKLLDEN